MPFDTLLTSSFIHVALCHSPPFIKQAFICPPLARGMLATLNARGLGSFEWCFWEGSHLTHVSSTSLPLEVTVWGSSLGMILRVLLFQMKTQLKWLSCGPES